MSFTFFPIYICIFSCLLILNMTAVTSYSFSSIITLSATRSINSPFLFCGSLFPAPARVISYLFAATSSILYVFPHSSFPFSSTSTTTSSSSQAVSSPVSTSSGLCSISFVSSCATVSGSAAVAAAGAGQSPAQRETMSHAANLLLHTFFFIRSITPLPPESSAKAVYHNGTFR